MTYEVMPGFFPSSEGLKPCEVIWKVIPMKCQDTNKFQLELFDTVSRAKEQMSADLQLEGRTLRVNWWPHLGRFKAEVGEKGFNLSEDVEDSAEELFRILVLNEDYIGFTDEWQSSTFVESDGICQFVTSGDDAVSMLIDNDGEVKSHGFHLDARWDYNLQL